MSIVNRRNAMLGWLTWSIGKRVIARKAKSALPSRDGGGGSARKKAATVGAALAAAAGAVLLWRAKHRDSTDHDSLASEKLGTPDE